MRESKTRASTIWAMQGYFVMLSALRLPNGPKNAKLPVS